MIGKLYATIDVIADDRVIVKASSIGFIVFLTSRASCGLVLGQEIELYIETVIRQDAIQLYGFLTSIEQQCFQLLTSVQGVGPRVAMAILSILDPNMFIDIIVTQDKALLLRADGVGAKVASRILLELKDKITKIIPMLTAHDNEENNPTPGLAGGFSAPPSNRGMFDDAMAGLLSLGFTKTQAQQAISHYTHEKDWDAAMLIRKSLQHLNTL